MEAGFVGIKTVNYAGKFENYYATPAGGELDSTQIEQINIQALGEGLSSAPWSKKFKGDFKIDNFTVGALAVASSNAAQSKIASSNIFPNPVSDMATIAMELNAVSDVKVTLSDMMGKEMMTITEGNMSSVNANINVANLNKGIYSVNYTINGASAKSELLMVK